MVKLQTRSGPPILQESQLAFADTFSAASLPLRLVIACAVKVCWHGRQTTYAAGCTVCIIQLDLLWLWMCERAAPMKSRCTNSYDMPLRSAQHVLHPVRQFILIKFPPPPPHPFTQVPQ